MAAEANETATVSAGSRRQVMAATAGSLGVFVILLAAYVLVLRLFDRMGLVDGDGTSAAWTALVVVLACAAAAGVGFSYQVLKLLKPENILQRLAKVRAEQVLPEPAPGFQATPTTDLPTASSRQGQWPEGVLPVVDGEGRLEGIVTAHDLAEAPGAQIVEQVMTKPAAMAYTDSSLADVYRVMEATDHGKIPIVERETGKYSGVISARRLLETLAVPGAGPVA